MQEYLRQINPIIQFSQDDFYALPKIIATAFFKDKIKAGNCVSSFDHRGQLNNITPEEFTKKIMRNKSNYLTCELSDLTKTNLTPIRLYTMEDAILQIVYYTDNIHKKNLSIITSIAILSSSQKFIDHVKTLSKEYILPEEETSGEEIFLLKADKNGVNLTAIGTQKSIYIPDNYTSIVQDKYIHLLEDLTDVNPCGRLSILSGEPGTGKTFLVRSLLSSNINVSFVIVKPDSIESISDPSSIPALISHHAKFDRPIIIVLEDADSCLTTRGGDNMSRLSAILNTSDGILGSTLDIRIIATTNAKKVEFDPAVLRPGRLCTHITTDKLDEEHASRIFTRLTGKSFVEAEVEIASKKVSVDLGFSGRSNKNPGYVLAEIYKAAYTYNRTIK